MARWFVGLLLISSSGFSLVTWAETSIIELLSAEENLTPQAFLLQVEQDYPGIISGFEIDVVNGELVYALSMIDTSVETITEFEFGAKNGRLMTQRVARLTVEDHEELVAVNLMEDKSLTFYALVTKAMIDKQAYILEAQLDHDLGVSYLELKLLNVDGKSKLAFDIKTLRPLPLLKWD